MTDRLIARVVVIHPAAANLQAFWVGRAATETAVVFGFVCGGCGASQWVGSSYPLRHTYAFSGLRSKERGREGMDVVSARLDLDVESIDSSEQRGPVTVASVKHGTNAQQVLKAISVRR